MQKLRANDDRAEKEVLFDGRAFLYLREGIFYLAIYSGNRTKGYIRKSLKTSSRDLAIQRATRAIAEHAVLKERGFAVQRKRSSEVLDEYLKLREKEREQFALGGYKPDQKVLSDAMLRQIRRVNVFWKKYLGNTPIDAVNDAKLEQYVEWRRDYYHMLSKEQWPNNAKPNPTDKTIAWEMTHMRTVLRFASRRGYLGNSPLPTYTFRVKSRIVRPAFTDTDYARLRRQIQSQISEAEKLENNAWKHARELLWDYVLTLANTGLRPGEINSLKESHAQIKKTENGKEYLSLQVEGKTGRRTVVGRETASKAVQRAKARNEKIRKASPNWNKEGYLFCLFNGNAITTLADQFSRILKLAGIEKDPQGRDYSLYSLRHYYADRSLRRNTDVFHIARNMGTSVQMIQMYYGQHTTPDRVAEQLIR